MSTLLGSGAVVGTEVFSTFPLVFLALLILHFIILTLSSHAAAVRTLATLIAASEGLFFHIGLSTLSGLDLLQKLNKLQNFITSSYLFLSVHASDIDEASELSDIPPQ